MKHTIRRPLLLAAATLVAASTAFAAGTDTWAGNTSATWSTAANWTGANTPPISGDDLVFGAAGTSGLTLTDDLASLGINSLTFNSGAGAFVIGGNAFSLAGNITDNSTALESLGNAITLTGATTVTTTAGGGNVTLSGALSGAGSITESGIGTLTLSGTNTYTGGTTISNGYLIFANAGAVPSTGSITVSTSGSLVASGAQTTVTGWLGSGMINTASTGSIAITGNSAENINFATGGFNSLGLSTSAAAATYSGTITTGTGGYIFGGAAGTNLTVSSTLSGANALTKNGTGTLTLNNTANSFTGNVTVNSGTLAATGNATGTTGALGAENTTGRTVTINSGATLSLALNNIFWNGSSPTADIPTLVINGGTVTTNNYNGVTNVTLTSGATLTNNDNSTSGGYGAYEFLGGATVTVNGTSGSTISGAGYDNLAGGATTTFNVASTGSGTDLTVSVALANGSPSSKPTNNGAAAVIKTGTGTMMLSGANSYTGGLTVNAGTVIAATPNQPNGAAGGGAVTVNSGGTISVITDNGLYGVNTSSNALTINAGSLVKISGTDIYGGNAVHLSALVMNGGTLSVTSGANTQYGNWALDWGVSTLGNGSTSSISGGNIALTEGGSSGGGTTFNIGAGDVLNISSAFAHTVGSYDTGLIKSGTGTMVLTGTNTYTSFTHINAGQVITGNTAALGAGTSLTVASGATLQIGNGTVNTVTLASGAALAINGTLRFDVQTSAITLQGAGGYTLASGSTLDLNNVFNAAGVYTLLSGGTGTKTDGAFSVIDFDTTHFSENFSQGVLTVTAVPEPSTYGLLGAGALAAIAMVRRHRRALGR